MGRKERRAAKRAAAAAAARAKRPAKVWPKPRKASHKAGGLNLDSVVAYLNSKPVGDLEVLWWWLEGVMQKHGVKANAKAHVACCADSPTGSVRGVLNYVKARWDQCDEGDCGNLQALHAVLDARFKLVGFEPAVLTEEEKQEMGLA